MSRFAVDPHWLLYLPPTMSPSATTSTAGLLEHPREAFSEYRADGVEHVVCEEKHMGSRAVVLVCRDSAQKRFGIDGGGMVYTRTGRWFFAPDLTEALLGRVRAAVGVLWDELDTDWLLLDAELLPWSAKAGGLLTQQYGAVGAAAVAGLSASLAALSHTHDRGIDVADLVAGVDLGRTTPPGIATPIAGTAGAPTASTASRWRRSPCWPPRVGRSPRGRTPGIWRWPTGW